MVYNKNDNFPGSLCALVWQNLMTWRRRGGRCWRRQTLSFRSIRCTSRDPQDVVPLPCITPALQNELSLYQPSQKRETHQLSNHPRRGKSHQLSNQLRGLASSSSVSAEGTTYFPTTSPEIVNFSSTIPFPEIIFLFLCNSYSTMQLIVS